MIWLHSSIYKLHEVTKILCVLCKGRISDGYKLYVFLVMKYIILVKIINNITDMMAPGFNLRCNGRFPLLLNVFIR